MIGIGRIEDLISWHSTEVSVEERLVDFRDTLFVIDDLSTLEGTPNARYRFLRKFSYTLSTNQAKGRSRIYKSATGIRHRQHRTIVLTSAEQSLSQLAACARTERQDGEYVRFLDLAATGKGPSDVFDRFEVNNASRPKLVKKLIKAILAGCGENHGTAFRVYVRGLVEMRTQLQRFWMAS
jgi:hypothetical protein